MDVVCEMAYLAAHGREEELGAYLPPSSIMEINNLELT